MMEVLLLEDSDNLPHYLHTYMMMAGREDMPLAFYWTIFVRQ